MPSRRKLLQAAVGGVAGMSLGRSVLFPDIARAQEGVDAQPSRRGSRDLGNGLYLVTLGETNVLAVTSGDGIALIDGAPAGHDDVLIDMLAALPGQGRVHTLFNSHWHPDQTGSNERFGQAGATIIAQQNTKLWLTTDVTWPWSEGTVRPLPAVALPNKTFLSQDEFEVGGRTAQCGHLRDCPHTDGDMYVFLPDDNLLTVGDAMYGTGWPSIDWWTGGWIGGLVGALDMLSSMANEGTRIVPARGPMLGFADLRKQYEMYSVIWERLAKTLYSGGGPKEALAANPTREFDAVMGPSDAFVRRAFESLWGYLSPDA